jgi:hypothetical protein
VAITGSAARAPSRSEYPATSLLTCFAIRNRPSIRTDRRRVGALSAHNPDGIAAVFKGIFYLFCYPSALPVTTGITKVLYMQQVEPWRYLIPNHGPGQCRDANRDIFSSCFGKTAAVLARYFKALGNVRYGKSVGGLGDSKLKGVRLGARTENQVSRMDTSGEIFVIFAIIGIIAWAAFQVWLRWHGPEQ